MDSKIWLQIFFLLFISCGDQDKEIIKSYSMNNEVISSEMNWNLLKNKKIFFGHQSVGTNLIDGISSLKSKYQEIPIDIEALSTVDSTHKGILYHDRIGSNRNPISKIDDFVLKVQNGVGENCDAAGFKFCYVDFVKGTDFEEIFEYYKKEIRRIEKEYPELKIIHFTVPLQTSSRGFKDNILKLFGKDIRFEYNLNREKFNRLLLDEFDEDDIFDIARFESTYPDGTRSFSVKGSEKAYSMIEEYTSDGGHLSDYGKQDLAQNFLKFLLELNYGR